MFKTIIQSWNMKNFFIFPNNARTLKAGKNIAYIFILKIFAILVNLGIVRVTYDYLGKEAYGVWLTILSVVSWATMFDMGIGNGLKNKLAEALAAGNKKDGKTFVSTAYAVIAVFIVFMYFIYVLISCYINWNGVFRTSVLPEIQLQNLLNYLIIFWLLGFLFSLINQVALSHQDAAVPNFIKLLTNVSIFIGLCFLNKIDTGSLSLVGYLYGITTITVFLLFSWGLYLFKYKEIMPSFRCVKIKYCFKLFSLSLKFFIIQIAVMVIFTTDNIIITQVLGPSHVVPYQVVLKIFGIFTMAFGILLTPLWAAYTEAHIKNDYTWIKTILKKLIILMMPIIAGVITIGALTPELILIWLGKDVGTDWPLIILMGLYVVICMWNNIFAFFLNSISMMNLQMYASIFGALINIPLSIYFAKNLGMNNAGVILGSIVTVLTGAVLGPIQTYAFLKKKENKSFNPEAWIWN